MLPPKNQGAAYARTQLRHLRHSGHLLYAGLPTLHDANENSGRENAITFMRWSSNNLGRFNLSVRCVAVLDFPNQSQFFNSTRHAVQFWGHDRAMEWSFFVTETALKRLQPSAERDEASLLRAFNSNRDRIYAAATKAYGRERRGSYELSVTDF